MDILAYAFNLLEVKAWLHSLSHSSRSYLHSNFQILPNIFKFSKLDTPYVILTDKSTNHDFMFKIVLAGDTGVGKSCLLS